MAQVFSHSVSEIFFLFSRVLERRPVARAAPASLRFPQRSLNASDCESRKALIETQSLRVGTHTHTHTRVFFSETSAELRVSGGFAAVTLLCLLLLQLHGSIRSTRGDTCTLTSRGPA